MADEAGSFVWRKSSFSGNGDCVELVIGRPDVRVRHSRNPDGGILLFASVDWAAFLTRVTAD